MQNDFLVGSTGFVGSNLAASHEFKSLFHSVNISQAWGKSPELLVYAGVRSEMFIANKYPDEDLKNIRAAEENISRINPRKLVLISTIAVYPDIDGVNEDTEIDSENLAPYGSNRRELELWTMKNVKDYLIVRLPALFGINLKKNFIYDLIHVIPSMLTESKFNDLLCTERRLEKYYLSQGNGFYKCINLNEDEKLLLKDIFRSIGFTALNFTDSRSVYQFYALRYLWQHIQIALSHGIRLMNIAVPPLSVREVHRYVTGHDFVNELAKPPFMYDMRTKHYEIFGGSDGYIMSREQELNEIKNFVEESIK